MANRGLNGWGLAFEAGKPYEGYVWVRNGKSGGSEKTAVVWVSLESGDGKQTVAEARLGAATSGLEPARFCTHSDCRDACGLGQFVVKLKHGPAAWFSATPFSSLDHGADSKICRSAATWPRQ